MKMKMSYEAHIAELARTGRVLIDVRPELPPHGGVARVLTVGADAIPVRGVQIHPVIDETTYCVALHELGHWCAVGGMVVTPAGLTPFQMQCHKMDQEDAAWQWARANAMEWTPPMEAVYVWARETYRRAVVEKYKEQLPPKRGRPLSEVFGPRK